MPRKSQVVRMEMDRMNQMSRPKNHSNSVDVA